MSGSDEFIVQPFKRRSGELTPSELLRCNSEAAAFRRGKQMQSRVDGMIFYRIETSASGDQWVELEVLATVGDVPAEPGEAA